MDSQVRQATMGTRHRTKATRTKPIAQKIKKMSNMNPIKKGLNAGAREGYAVPVSYNIQQTDYIYM